VSRRVFRDGFPVSSCDLGFAILSPRFTNL
jgi:hypothetical protein